MNFEENYTYIPIFPDIIKTEPEEDIKSNIHQQPDDFNYFSNDVKAEADMEYCLKIIKTEYIGVKIEDETDEKTIACLSNKNSLLKEPSVLNLEKETNACGFCSFQTANNSELKLHIETHLPNDENDSTSDISSGIEFMEALMKNRKSYLSREKKKMFSCALCSFQTINRYVMNTHEYQHSDNMLSCKLCNYKTNSYYTMKNHRKNVHPVKKYFSCAFCNFATNNNRSKRNHDKYRQQEKRFSCEYCCYKTQYKHHMRDHNWTHKGEKANTCLHCDYQSNRKKEMTEHVNTKHKDKLPNKKKFPTRKLFTCKLCHYQSNNSVVLMRHMATHSDPKTALQTS